MAVVQRELENIATVISSVNGRDKVMRFVDFSVKALSYYTDERSENLPLIKSVEAHLMLVI